MSSLTCPEVISFSVHYDTCIQIKFPVIQVFLCIAVVFVIFHGSSHLLNIEYMPRNWASSWRVRQNRLYHGEKKKDSKLPQVSSQLRRSQSTRTFFFFFSKSDAYKTHTLFILKPILLLL